MDYGIFGGGKPDIPYKPDKGSQQRIERMFHEIESNKRKKKSNKKDEQNNSNKSYQ